MRKSLSLLMSAAVVCASPLTSRAGGFLLVANKGDHTVGIIDTVAGEQIATVPEDGITCHELICSPDGKTAYAPIYGNAGVGSPGTDGSIMRVIDVASRTVTGTVDFGKGVRPHCAMIGPKNGMLYVSTELENSITIIDPKSLKIVGSVPTGKEQSHMFTISSDGRLGYTANVNSGTVSVLDMDAKKVVTIIPVCEVTQRIAISKDDKWVFTSDQKTPRLAVIDTAKNAVDHWIDMPGVGYGSAVTPDGKYLVIALPHNDRVAVIDIEKGSVSRSIEVPRSAQETLVRPDGGEVYVSCDASKKVAIIDTKHWVVKKLVSAGAGVDGLAWAPSAP